MELGDISAICRNSFINKRSVPFYYLKNWVMRELIYHNTLLIRDTYWLTIQRLSNIGLDILQYSINKRHLLVYYLRT